MLAASAGAATRFTPSTWAQPAGSNDAVRIGVIGLNGKGYSHIRQLRDLPGARVVAVCDVDPQVLQKRVQQLKDRQMKVSATTDARKIFESKDVDAVIVATSNHWHALLTVWACQAGKDVYVEKPVSRTLWEGRKMVEAAERYGRVVQCGTQYRSDVGLPEAIDYIQAGNLGAMKFIHTVCYKLRESIGEKLPWYPDWLDYDMFCGPTPMVPLDRAHMHYDWHWVWNTGNGELGNNGIHVLDIGRRFAGHDTLPQRVMSVGGKFAIDDVSETPNTHMTVYDYGDGIPMLFEARALPAKPGVNYTDHYHGVRPNGLSVLCEDGYFSGYNGGAAYDLNGKRIRTFDGDGGDSHMQNFLDAVRDGRPQDVRAPIQIGHGSTSLCHFGNISHRLGRTAPIGDIQEKLEGFYEAGNTLEGMQTHLGVHGVDIEKHPFTLGPWISIDNATETITAVENGDEEALTYARYLLKETQRPQWAIPTQV